MRFLISLAAMCLSLSVSASAAEPLEQASLQARIKASPNAPLLIELVTWRCIWNNRSTVTVDGRMKNISDISIKGVAAQITVLDEDGNPLGSGDKYVSKSPLNPEDVSSFQGKVTVGKGSKRPRKCTIDVIDQDGTYVNWREAAN